MENELNTKYLCVPLYLFDSRRIIISIDDSIYFTWWLQKHS